MLVFNHRSGEDDMQEHDTVWRGPEDQSGSSATYVHVTGAAPEVEAQIWPQSLLLADLGCDLG